MSVLVKICGITSVADAIAAAEAGADFVGFVFSASSRMITPERALDISRNLPVGIRTAGVFVDEDPLLVEVLADTCDLDLLQFHGVETPEYCARFGEKAVKAIRVADSTSLEDMGRYDVPALLLDTYVRGRAGGTGQTFDWTIAAKAAEQARIILSGGLAPGNVAEAVRAVRPVMVDVSSGVESSPGIKDAAKMKSFVENAKKEQ